MDTATPAAIGKYRIEREIGRGASSAVYLAHDTFNQRPVAVKQLHAHLLADARQADRMRRNLRNEALLSGQLRHAHERGLVHRDIKPANVMLQPDCNIKLADFGTALSVQGETTQLAGMVGSPSYMSPEQVREETCTHLSDMFSLAVVMYEMLTGRRPFDGDSDFATLYRISTEEAVPPSVLRPGLPAGLDAVVLRALAKKPGERYARWADFADALLAVNCSLPARRAEDRESERFHQLRRLEFFSSFTDAALWEALRLGTLRNVPAGMALMEEGSAGESFGVLLVGEVEVSRGGRPLSTVRPGVTLGEMAYLQPDKPLRSATITARGDVLLLEIRNDALRAASHDLQMQFDKAFIRLLVSRLVESNERA